jgi:hypothetical protein
VSPTLCPSPSDHHNFFIIGLDDNCLDAVLGDGIHGQTLQDNICYQELSSQSDLRKAVENEKCIVSRKVFIFMKIPSYRFSIIQKNFCVNDFQIHYTVQ